MTLLLLVTTAVAAFWVWLTVRVLNRRERWAKWTLALVVGLPLLYVASFGPACWLADRGLIAREIPLLVYDPLSSFLAAFDAEWLRSAMMELGEWGSGHLEFPRQPTARLIVRTARGTGLIASLATIFAGLCVWLGVRVINRQERWAKWTAAIAPLAVVTAYPITYLLLMEPMWVIPSFGAPWERYPHYRIIFTSQETAEEVFGPAHRLDRSIRPNFWGEKRPYKGGKHPDEIR